jgi:hypothetical protein
MKLLSIFRVSPNKDLEGKQEQEMLEMINEVEQNIRGVSAKIAEKKAEMKQRDDPKTWDFLPNEMKSIMGRFSSCVLQLWPRSNKCRGIASWKRRRKVFASRPRYSVFCFFRNEIK